MAIPSITAYQLPGPEALPENTADWNLEPRRALLLIHDMQGYFVDTFPQGSPRRELIENIVRLREACGRRSVPVAYTEQPGDMSQTERGLLADFWGAGMRRTPEERAVISQLAPRAGDWRLTKLRYSAFYRSSLLDRMRESGRDQLILCGVYAHIGVLVTAVDAFSNDIQPFLVGDAVADFSADYHHMALTYAAQRCAQVRTADWVLGQVERTADLTSQGNQ